MKPTTSVWPCWAAKCRAVQPIESRTNRLTPLPHKPDNWNTQTWWVKSIWLSWADFDHTTNTGLPHALQVAQATLHHVVLCTTLMSHALLESRFTFILIKNNYSNKKTHCRQVSFNSSWQQSWKNNVNTCYCMSNNHTLPDNYDMHLGISGDTLTALLII